MTDDGRNGMARLFGGGLRDGDARTAIHDVAIIGMGPVGTALAGLLGRRGLDVIVLEQDADVFALPRAAHIDHTGLRAVQELGCLEQVLPSMTLNPGIEFVSADHSRLMWMPAGQTTWSGVPTSVYFHQPGFDRALRAAVAALPTITVHLEAEVVDVTQDTNEVSLRTAWRGGNQESEPVGTVRARYAVACDGAASPVREMAGMRLEDLGFHERWLVVDLLLGDADRALPGHALYVCDPIRPHVFIPMPGRRHRVEFMVHPGEDTAAITEPHKVASVLRELVGEDFGTVERAAVYTFHGLVAQRWRSSRLLLAGDAAHQMPPFLGQGMCSGLRDATNLAWKIDHVLRGAPMELLDTYEIERSPHVREVIKAAIDYGAIVGITDPQAARERDEAIRRDHRSLFFGLPSLQSGPMVLEGGGGLFGQPRVGGKPLDDAVGQRFLVLARHDAALGSTSRWWADVVGAWVTTIADLPQPDPALAEWLDSQGADVAVVRPDRYVLAAVAGTLDQITGDVSALLQPAENTAARLDTSTRTR
jgi:3-(3-hydroxy-phenyl)propionate hydroxylase